MTGTRDPNRGISDEALEVAIKEAGLYAGVEGTDYPAGVVENLIVGLAELKRTEDGGHVVLLSELGAEVAQERFGRDDSAAADREEALAEFEDVRQLEPGSRAVKALGAVAHGCENAAEVADATGLSRVEAEGVLEYLRWMRLVGAERAGAR